MWDTPVVQIVNSGKDILLINEVIINNKLYCPPMLVVSGLDSINFIPQMLDAGGPITVKSSCADDIVRVEIRTDHGTYNRQW